MKYVLKYFPVLIFNRYSRQTRSSWDWRCWRKLRLLFPGPNQKMTEETRSKVMSLKLVRRGQTSGNPWMRKLHAKIQNSLVGFVRINLIIRILKISIIFFKKIYCFQLFSLFYSVFMGNIFFYFSSPNFIWFIFKPKFDFIHILIWNFEVNSIIINCLAIYCNSWWSG